MPAVQAVKEALLKMGYKDVTMSNARRVKKLLDVASDPRWELRAWRNFIDTQIEEYGEDAIMYTDSGYNNVSLMVEVVRKKPS